MRILCENISDIRVRNIVMVTEYFNGYIGEHLSGYTEVPRDMIIDTLSFRKAVTHSIA